MKTILTVENASFWYTSERVLYKNLSLDAREGEIIAILGPNGVGKTTFLRCMMGMLAWKEGRTLLEGKNITELQTREIGKTIAYVPQARSLPFSFTVLDVVLMGRAAHIGPWAQPGKEDYRLARLALERMGIGSMADRTFSRLSGGEAQMVLIARALAGNPKIIVLDEPESHLDFRNQLIILTALRDLCDERGITCIVNTHYPEHALRIADRALLLGNDGRTPRFGGVYDTLSEELLRDYFKVRIKTVDFQDGERTHRAVYPLEPEYEKS